MMRPYCSGLPLELDKETRTWQLTTWKCQALSWLTHTHLSPEMMAGWVC